MARAFLLFSSNKEANRLVAGIPAAVRAGVIVYESGKLQIYDDLTIAVPGGWQPSDWASSEFTRLLPGTRIALGDPDKDNLAAGDLIIEGISALCGKPIVLADQSGVAQWLAGQHQATGAIRQLNTIGSGIVKATGKPSDG